MVVAETDVKFPMIKELKIPPPAYLIMEKTGRLANTWRLWRTQYADFRAVTKTDRESSPAQLAPSYYRPGCSDHHKWIHAQSG
ncbi:unnamed protein product [Echinostoma caproni]|uniref:PH domain-containing protein n=1 Tax=Echinostoma caproni TaxID=27848 RepID=A0A183AHB9_9TREM|nr:unnamed protein product [Echinostoma caproni]